VKSEVVNRPGPDIQGLRIDDSFHSSRQTLVSYFKRLWCARRFWILKRGSRRALVILDHTLSDRRNKVP
jgi:hypothetical protein